MPRTGANFGIRALDQDFDPDIVAEIDRRIQSLRDRERVGILLAIESGSRAWGFPSPDSDYDCRFIYVRRREEYLSLFPRRDVIELPLEGAFDIGGWDLKKALRLLLKGNAVMVEWLTSPFAYAGEPLFRDECLDLARKMLKPAAVARHYLHFGERQRRTYFADTRAVQLKKIFYALRPAVALRWMRLHPGCAVAPMHFPTLVAESALPDEVVGIVTDLMARKAATRELGSGVLPPPIAELVDGEFQTAATLWSGEVQPIEPEMRDAADDLFRRWVGS
jgi:predicted nucleotidyltransferase